MFSFRFSRFDDIFEKQVAQRPGATPNRGPLPGSALQASGSAGMAAASAPKASGLSPGAKQTRLLLDAEDR